MRSLFLLVLLCNILLALWQYTRSEMQDTEVRATDPGIDRLIMLNELASIEELLVVDTGVNETVREAEVLGDEMGGPEPVPDMEDHAELTGAGDQESPVDAAAAQVDSPALQTTLPEAGTEAVEATCFRLGPFPSSAKAELAENILGQQRLKVSIETEETSEDRYWVMLSAQSSFSEARRIEELLREKGVRDLQVLTFAGRRNAISLGVYRNKAIADARMKKLERMGYAPQMDIIPRKRTTYWLNIVVDGDKPLSDKLMEEILPIQEVRQEQRQCK